MLKLLLGEIAMLDLIRPVVLDEGGATAIEYGFIAVLVSIAGMASFTQMGSVLNGFFSYVNGLIVTANPGS
jgi:Flp pilus assembly pilin Flp